MDRSACVAYDSTQHILIKFTSDDQSRKTWGEYNFGPQVEVKKALSFSSRLPYVFVIWCLGTSILNSFRYGSYLTKYKEIFWDIGLCSINLCVVWLALQQ
jgi:hypothetical protein